MGYRLLANPMLTLDRFMLLQSRLHATPAAVIDFCQRWHVAELALFGSVLREDFHADSDIDVLISFDTIGDERWNLFDLIKMQQELEALFQRRVDLVEKSGLRNPYRRGEILNTCQTIYGSE